MTEQEEKRKRPESGMSAGVTAALIALILAVTAGVLALLYFTALRPLLQKARAGRADAGGDDRGAAGDACGAFGADTGGGQ